MTRTTRIRVTNRTTRYDGNGDHAAATRYDNDGGGEDQTVTMKMKAARKTKRRHGEDDGDRKDEEDEDETTKAKTRRTMKRLDFKVRTPREKPVRTGLLGLFRRGSRNPDNPAPKSSQMPLVGFGRKWMRSNCKIAFLGAFSKGVLELGKFRLSWPKHIQY